MPPKTKFDKEAIVEAALEIAKERGLSGITARSVAQRLKASVAPIYVNFATIEELVEAVVYRVFAMTDEMLKRQQGTNTFENIGRASLAFARAYPVLYRELTIQPNPYMASYDTVEEAMIEAMAEDQKLKDWTLKERKRLLLKMRMFQMGLTTMVTSGHVPSWVAEGELEEILIEVGEELMEARETKSRLRKNTESK